MRSLGIRWATIPGPGASIKYPPVIFGDMDLLFVTSNPHKVAEAREGLERRAAEDGAPPGLGDLRIEQCHIPYPEVQADTLEEVAEHGIGWLRERPALFARSSPARNTSICVGFRQEASSPLPVYLAAPGGDQKK